MLVNWISTVCQDCCAQRGEKAKMLKNVSFVRQEMRFFVCKCEKRETETRAHPQKLFPPTSSSRKWS